MTMIYRRHVEFAVGHGVSVHAEPASRCVDRAARISGRVISSAEVPRVTTPAPAGLVFDMKALAETDATAVRRCARASSPWSTPITSGSSDSEFGSATPPPDQATTRAGPAARQQPRPRPGRGRSPPPRAGRPRRHGRGTRGRARRLAAEVSARDMPTRYDVAMRISPSGRPGLSHTRGIDRRINGARAAGDPAVERPPAPGLATREGRTR
jgi:hypothetical protein